MGFDLKSARHWAEDLIRQAVSPGARVIDATMGNGHDTVWLCELVGEQGCVYAFDIQQDALERTRARLQERGLEKRAELFCAGHEHADEYVGEMVDAVVFNLGWLPGAEKRVTTQTTTTLEAVTRCLSLLREGGLMTVCIYPGHEEGAKELGALLDWAKALPDRQYDAMIRGYLNQRNDPPVLIAVKKKLSRRA